jgi:hypothetical protein
VKFKLVASTYSEVLRKVLDEYNGKDLSDDVRSKPPTDSGDSMKKLERDESDKTIVVTPEIHEELNAIKNEYIMDKGFVSRGPSAVSISDILLDLLSKFKIKHKL